MAVEDELVSDPGGLPLISEGRAGRLLATADLRTADRRESSGRSDRAKASSRSADQAAGSNP